MSRKLVDPTSPLSVSGMANAVGLSRDRFYDLLNAGIFPPPAYRIDSRRPFYPPELQRICLAIRAEGVGYNGQLVMFNRSSRRRSSPAAVNIPSTARASSHSAAKYASLAGKLRYLGIDDITPQAAHRAVATCFPGGIDNLVEGRVLASLLRYLRPGRGPS